MARERQITFGKYGHTLNRRQAISPDGQWAVYDTRNDDAHIARTDSIEMVHLVSGEIISLYRTPSSSIHGPGVGAAAYHPSAAKVVFIHGLESCDANNPYSAARRFGAIADMAKPGTYVHAEGRSIVPESYDLARGQGKLSGGTHAHSWSRAGWLSFTYNDALLERLAKSDPTVRDQRTVGFMMPRAAMEYSVGSQAVTADGENFEGTMFACLAAHLVVAAAPGSDDIEQAVEECWLESSIGQTEPTGLAFLGSCRHEDGNLYQEIYRCIFPEKFFPVDDKAQPGNADSTSRLGALSGIKQQRVTHTSERRYPGVQGPRNWLVASPDSRYVYTVMRDDRGIVQWMRVDLEDGNLQQLTDLTASIENQIAIDREGTFGCFVSRNQVVKLDLTSGQLKWLTSSSLAPVFGAIHFADSDRLVFNRVVDGYLQICSLDGVGSRHSQ